MRTGQYKTINVAPVHEGELIENDPFTGDMRFDISARTSEKIIGYVAYFRLLNGFEKYLYMTVEETKAHGKRYSQSFNSASSRWQSDFDAMSMKTVLKMLLSKYGILSIEMQTSLLADQSVVTEAGDYEYPDNPGDVIEGEEVKTGNESLKKKLRKEEESALEAPVEVARSECPDEPGTFFHREHCATRCGKFEGCPVWINSANQG